MISKSLSTSEKYSALYAQAGNDAEFCQALYPLLIAHADDFGRLQGDAFTVKHLALPASPRSLDEFETALQYLHAVGLAIWYEVGGRRYLQIVDFDEHQSGLHKRTKSSFPRVPGNSGKVPETPDQLKRTEENGTEENRSRDVLADRFDRFWEAYPKKVGKDGASKAFHKRQPDDDLLVAMLAAIEQQKRSVQWRRDNGQYIPHPATWLNQGRWKDELQPERRAPNALPPSSWDPADCRHTPHCGSAWRHEQTLELEAARAARKPA